ADARITRALLRHLAPRPGGRYLDLFLYSGKERPALYLDPGVRRGISTFTQDAEARELRAGLSRLAADLASGRVREVRARHASGRGDYAFVVAALTRPARAASSSGGCGRGRRRPRAS
ncbi:MAG: hypothetical protein ACREMB_00435, partial [Candidatus Rokuibacteriota bacterium]